MNAKEHFEWCKERAKEYVAMGDAQNAFNSFVIDMKNHEETKDRIPAALAMIGMMEILNGPQAVWHWIEGFPSP
jgi:uncharacterized membrane protein YecN with MAPEG domain